MSESRSGKPLFRVASLMTAAALMVHATAGRRAQCLASAVDEGTLSVAELLRQYCTRVHARTMNYQETARRLEIDHRTARRHIDPELLAELSDTEADQGLD